MGGVGMGEIPARLLADLSPASKEKVSIWWIQLEEADRIEVGALCDPDREVVGAPRTIGGRFLPDDGAAGWSEWMAALFEDLVAQPDPVFYEPPSFRFFHIG